ncbi:hypothetical protein NSZ01_14180 [Nocardioides szechwanensis]|uniref:Polysaccharide pyruvyl transferase family protein WcaK n=2 Tax=Nocardioides szechwanensis TaxID=1005944 RepID=A0A1H0BPQ1_9ACTN|nr:hypothetical protein NSZ01_14180 [Nocardioides szechwanensis]SDN47630.1 Polysaccharide pyruvyl transferase family protein WcaK [Nocardioides szechwanensis]
MGADFTPVNASVWRSVLRRWASRLGLDPLLRRARTHPAINPWRDDPEVARCIGDADLVVIGGGNLIFDVDPWTRSWEFFDSALNAARGRGIPVIGMCLGIGPFATDEQNLNAVRSLEKCAAVSFRDRRSLELYRRYSSAGNAHLSVDPVFTMPLVVGGAGERGVIGVNFVDMRLAGAGPWVAMKNRRRYCELIAAILRRFTNDIVLFSTDLNDYPLLFDIDRRVSSPRCRVAKVDGRHSLLTLYASFDVVVAARMHALITSYAQLIPVVGLAWQSKVREFFDIVEDDSSVFECDNLPAEIPNILEKIHQKIEARHEERREMTIRRKAIEERFLVNHELVASVQL